MPDISDVLNDLDAPPLCLGNPPDQVAEQESPQIADVSIAVNGRAAAVHHQRARSCGDDVLDPPGSGVVQPQHGTHPSGRARKYSVASDGPGRRLAALSSSPLAPLAASSSALR